MKTGESAGESGARSPHSKVALAARLTPAGRGAVATVAVRGDCSRLDGESPIFRAANGRPLSSQPIGRIVFGTWGRTSEEDVVVCRVADQVTEICCHGGDAAVRRILGDLAALGTRIVSASEYAEVTSNRLDTEWAETLSRATTARTAALIVAQQSALRSAIEPLRDTNDSLQIVARIDAILRWAAFGQHLTEPWVVVLAGRPNAGKSSLLNALVGFTRSIVFHEPGTTRDVVTADTAYDGWPLRFVDTAGLRDGIDLLEAEGIRRTREQLARADLVLEVVATSEAPIADDPSQLQMSHSEPSRSSTQGAQGCTLGASVASLFVAHKADLPNLWGERVPAGALFVSSQTGQGVDALLRAVVARLIPETPPAGAAVPFTGRQVALLQAARDAVSGGHLEESRRSLAELLGQSSESTSSASGP